MGTMGVIRKDEGQIEVALSPLEKLADDMEL